MESIYVEIGPVDVSKAPKEHAMKAKKYLEGSLTSEVDKAKGFTTKTEGEGYQVRVKLLELTLDPKGASCKLTGELTRYPKQEMVSTAIMAAAKASGGKPDTLVRDCVEGAAQGMMDKVIPVMQKQAR